MRRFVDAAASAMVSDEGHEGCLIRRVHGHDDSWTLPTGFRGEPERHRRTMVERAFRDGNCIQSTLRAEHVDFVSKQGVGG
jgi:hypothetical protein